MGTYLLIQIQVMKSYTEWDVPSIPKSKSIQRGDSNKLLQCAIFFQTNCLSRLADQTNCLSTISLLGTPIVEVLYNTKEMPRKHSVASFLQEKSKKNCGLPFPSRMDVRMSPLIISIRDGLYWSTKWKLQHLHSPKKR